MKLTIDYSKNLGSVKPMNAVNNGPVYPLYKDDPDSFANNLALYREANIPYARTHDASFFTIYGLEHTVDVHCIFPNFDADPDDPASYDFACTDNYLKAMLLAGTKPFYRLGCKIENYLPKRYAANPPKDFHKWAVICEHIVAHYNKGWADGFRWDIEYWEGWNEPNDETKPNWTGTKEQYFELYGITAKHLKERFPKIKIGGPVTCFYDEPWIADFLDYVRGNALPLDFCSWHNYEKNIAPVVANIRRCREFLSSFGFTGTETILNEWNYIWEWSGAGLLEAHDVIGTIKGAAFVSAYMTACQYAPLDMLMYYDARPTTWNGIFASPRYTAMKTYYPIKAWGEMLTLGMCCAVSCDIPDIYAVSAKEDVGKMSMITYYTDEEDAVPYTAPWI